MMDGPKGGCKGRGAIGEPIVKIRLTKEEKKKARRLLVRQLAESVVDRLRRDSKAKDDLACEQTEPQDAAR